MPTNNQNPAAGIFLSEEEKNPLGSAQQQRSNYMRQVYGVMGGQRGRSGQQVRNPLTGEMQDQPGMFQGGTSNRRGGLAENGMVGSPQLGTVSELMRYSRQVPGGEQYLRGMGMMPEMITTQLNGSGMGMGASKGSSMDNGSDRAGQYAFGQQLANGQRAYVNGRLIDTSTGQPINNASYGNFTSPGFQNFQAGQGGLSGLAGQLGLGGASGAGGIGGNLGTGIQAKGGGGDLGDFLQGKLQNFMQNPSGFSPDDVTNMRTRAQETVSGLQRGAENRSREDAVRRGASTRAGGDADIRDQLNRVSASGAQSQIRAGQDIDRMLAELSRQGTLGGINAGTGLYGQQLGEIRSLREMLVALNALQQQQGPLGGLQFVLGGGR